MTPSVLNVVGEREREARSPRANLVEAFCLAVGVLIVLWPVAFGLGILSDWHAASIVARWALVLMLLWMLIGSPFWHRDSAKSLGLGSPGRLWRAIKGRYGWARWRLVIVVLAIFAGLVALSVANWPLVARAFRLPAEARAWPQTPWQWGAVFGFSVALAAVVSTCAIRYDNLVPALRLAAIVCGALLVYSGLAAWLHRGEGAFTRFHLERLPVEIIGYTFWGFVQQMAFTAYFATRLRKGFGPGPGMCSDATAVDGRHRKWSGGLVAAFTFGPVVWLMIRAAHGPAVPLELLPMAMIFAFPVGMVWTHFYRVDKRRMLAAMLSGAFFGLIHIDSYGLVLVTAGLGTIFAYAAMEDRLRNLATFALMHGFLGTTFHKLFREEGILKVDYRVGPWNVREPSVEVLVAPVLCICGYAALALWAAKCQRPTPLEEISSTPDGDAVDRKLLI